MKDMSFKMIDWYNTISGLNDIKSIVSVSAESMGHPLIITDAMHHVLSYHIGKATLPEEALAFIERGRLRETDFNEHHYDIIIEACQSNVPIYVELKDDGHFLCPIRYNESVMGYILCYKCGKPFPRNCETLLKILSDRLLPHLIQDSPYSLKMTNNFENIICQLIDSVISTQDDLYAYLWNYRINVQRYFRAYLLQFENPSSRKNTDYVQRTIRSFNKDTAVVFFRGLLLVLNMGNEKKSLLEFDNNMRFICHKSSCKMVIGPVFENLINLKGIYTKCSSLLLGDSLFNAENENIIEYNDYRLTSFLLHLQKDKDCIHYFHPLLFAFNDFDTKHDSELLFTLYTYLTLKSVTKTAEKLFLHRSTVLYRLEKIREISGFDMENEDEVLLFLISYKIYQGLKKDDP